MTNRLLVSFALPTVTLLLASCSFAPNCGNSHAYKGYAATPPLKAPAGVTLPAADAAYQIPAGGTAVAPVAAPAATTSTEPCLVTPPTVLTAQDMTKAGSPAAAAKPAVAPAASTKVPASPTPPPATHPQPVAGAGSME